MCVLINTKVSDLVMQPINYYHKPTVLFSIQYMCFDINYCNAQNSQLCVP